jgi:hypothetical protein
MTGGREKSLSYRDSKSNFFVFQPLVSRYTDCTNLVPNIVRAAANKQKKKKNYCSNFFLRQKLKSRASFIQLNPILDITLCGFNLRLFSTESEGPLAIFPFAAKSHMSFKVRTQL